MRKQNTTTALQLTSDEKIYIQQRFGVLSSLTVSSLLKVESGINGFYQCQMTIIPTAVTREKASLFIDFGLNCIIQQLNTLENRATGYQINTLTKRNAPPTVILLVLLGVFALNIWLYTLAAKIPPEIDQYPDNPKSGKMLLGNHTTGTTGGPGYHTERAYVGRGFAITGNAFFTLAILISIIVGVGNFYKKNNKDPIFIDKNELQNLNKLINFINILIPDESEKIMPLILTNNETSYDFKQKLAEINKKAKELKKIYNQYPQEGSQVPTNETSSLVQYSVVVVKGDKDIIKIAKEFLGIQIDNNNQYQNIIELN